MSRKLLPVLGLFVLVSLFALPSLVVPSISFSSAPMVRSPSTTLSPSASTTTSLNWGGYAVSEPAGSVNSVVGSWKQPRVTCTSKTALQAAAFWVGIDGFTSSTVEQTGTIAECTGGLVTYSAWYEMYPNPLTTISTITVHPGNSFTASVTYASGLFTVKISDTTTGKSFTLSLAVSGASRSSAEWIAEAPSSIFGIVQLPNFGRVTFTNCQTSTTSNTGTIKSFGSAAVSINIVSEASAKLMAQTSALNSAGSGFSVAWKSVGP